MRSRIQRNCRSTCGFPFVTTLEGEEERDGGLCRKISTLSRKTAKEDGTSISTISTERIKNIQGGNKQREQDYSDVRMYEVESALNPVRAYELLLKKLNPQNQNLFQKPMKNFVYDDPVWFTKEVLGKNTLGNIMKNISRKAGTKKTYTNHCVRATTVTDLYQAGVDTQQICAITKHCNESTLKHYMSAPSDEQKQHASTVLSTAFSCKKKMKCMLLIRWITTREDQ